MRRTQVYLDDYLWNVLHARAKSQNTTISELVREALHERYLSRQHNRTKAMQEFVGIRKQHSELVCSTDYIRSLRQGRFPKN